MPTIASGDNADHRVDRVEIQLRVEHRRHDGPPGRGNWHQCGASEIRLSDANNTNPIATHDSAPNIIAD
jgi:hypothetical protein